MQLVAAVIEVSDFEWCLTDNAETQERGRFFLIILNLATIEVIMHLEEQSLDEIMENSELLVSCYYIIESAVSYMASDRLLLLDQQESVTRHVAHSTLDDVVAAHQELT